MKEILVKKHFSALSELRPEKGWATIEDYLKIIKEENCNVRIMFEHRSDMI